MKTTRRTFLGGLAATSIPVTAVAAALIKDRKAEMRECLFRIENYLFEETGQRWTIVAAAPDNKAVSISHKDQSLHDPLGLFGEKLRFGKPIA